MFKKDVTTSSKSKVKSSTQRALRTKLTEQFPLLTPHIDEILPKKSQLDLIKITDARAVLYALGPKPLFFQHMDDPLLPHLALVHAFPACFPTVAIDRGAIRFVLAGATLMAPGLTSAGGWLPPAEEALQAGDVVVVRAEGKEHACLVGVLKMGTEEIKAKGKGVALDEGHYLGDGLWKVVLD
ncbi:MAG: translation machinery-associated protein 20 [Trizodia sp. TS-e1964]|nr:MAG: translation machinery-associated protein 20 [Trizodia sp. TS-e1964]